MVWYFSRRIGLQILSEVRKISPPFLYFATRVRLILVVGGAFVFDRRKSFLVKLCKLSTARKSSTPLLLSLIEGRGPFVLGGLRSRCLGSTDATPCRLMENYFNPYFQLRHDIVYFQQWSPGQYLEHSFLDSLFCLSANHPSPVALFGRFSRRYFRARASLPRGAFHCQQQF